MYGCLQLVRDQLPLELMQEASALILCKTTTVILTPLGVAVKKSQKVSIPQIKYMTQTAMEEQGSNAKISGKGRPCFGRAILSCLPSPLATLEAKTTC